MGNNDWRGGYAEWMEGNTAYLSVVFSWNLDRAYSRAVWYKSAGYNVRAGGPAISLNPDYLAGVAEIGGQVDALSHHNPNATFTSRGCVRKCGFCAVPKIEGGLVELKNWPVKPIICDNNLTACSSAHFDRVIDRLIESQCRGVDFNQGLDARLLTEHHAARIADLRRAGLLSIVRLAWDHSNLEAQFRYAYGILRDAGIPGRSIRVYCLIGFDDTPEDARYRLETVYGMGSLPSPMRYQPLNSKRRNEYIGRNWSHQELVRYMRYYSNLIRLRAIPFDEFSPNKRLHAESLITGSQQMLIV